MRKHLASRGMIKWWSQGLSAYASPTRYREVVLTSFP